MGQGDRNLTGNLCRVQNPDRHQRICNIENTNVIRAAETADLIFLQTSFRAGKGDDIVFRFEISVEFDFEPVEKDIRSS